MHNVEMVMRNSIEVSDVTLSGGWRGQVVVRAGGKEQFSKSEWEMLLAKPEKLSDGAQKTLKNDGANSVTVKYMGVNGRGIKAVIKSRYRGGGIRELFRSMGTSHAIRNFTAAVRVKQCGLPVAAPLAAVYHRKLLFCDQSIYISEYAEGMNLHEFLKNTRENAVERYRTMQELSERMADIFANMHKNNLWHRDAKATNFVVSKDGNGEYHVTMTDVDGIKQYFYRSEGKQMRGLWRMAASVMELTGVTRTDYLRTFEMYCDKVGIAKELRRSVYCRLAEKAEKKFKQRQLKQGY